LSAVDGVDDLVGVNPLLDLDARRGSVLLRRGKGGQ
jgi:hypothetical protein